MLAGFGLRDVYASHAYVAASCLLEPGEPRLLVLDGAEGGIVFPLILRDIPAGSGLRDVTTPYGYGGPLASGSSPSWRRFDEAYQSWSDRMNVVSTFVRFHPLYGNQDGPATMDVSALSGVIAWRVEPGRDLLAGMHPHHRRLVRKATSAGIRPSVSRGPSSLEGFRRLYESTMRRLDASSFYFFGDAYWEALACDLREQLVLVESVLEGQVVAAVLCMGSAPWLHYHLGASDELGRRSGASHLALFVAAQWAQAHGYTTLNLGGGVGGGNDPLLAFKTRFDPEGLIPAHVGRQINDPIAYRELSGTDADDTFFPAYRALERAGEPDVEVRVRGE